MWSITSFAQTPLRSLPFSTKRAVSGTVTRTSFVYQAFAMSVEPTPNAKQPERAGHARVRVGAGDELTGQRDLLDDLVVADGLGAHELAVAMDLAVELHALALREVLLHGGELLGLLLEAHVAMRLRHDEVEEREVIAERPYRSGIGDLRVLAHLGDEERLGHRRHVLVREAHVGAREERVARLHRGDAGGAGLRVGDDVRGEDLLAERHRARGRGDRGRRDLAREARAVVREEAAVLDDRRADRRRGPS